MEKVQEEEENALQNCNNSLIVKELLKSLNRSGYQYSSAGLSDNYYDDSSNSYKYIIFVLVVYAVSFMSLMVKYFRKSRQDSQTRDDFLYNEFIKRETFRCVKPYQSSSLVINAIDSFLREKHLRENMGMKKMMVDALAQQLPIASIGIQMSSQNKKRRRRDTGSSSIANEEIKEEEELVHENNDNDNDDESTLKSIYMKSASVT